MNKLSLIRASFLLLIGLEVTLLSPLKGGESSEHSSMVAVVAFIGDLRREWLFLANQNRE